MNYLSVIKDELVESSRVLDNFVSNPLNIENIEKAASLIVSSFKNNGKVISCGNGGSHCDAMHFAEELTGRYRFDRAALPAIAISDASHITCAANDMGFDHIFSRFIDAVGKEQDEKQNKQCKIQSGKFS